MSKIFQPINQEEILYFKMYSNFVDGTTETCCGFILIPNALQKDLICLQSIEFAFNEQGEVLQLNFIYSGHEKDIQKIVRETLAGIIALKQYHRRGEKLCVFNKESKILSLEMVPCNGSQAYLSDIIDFIKDIYRIKTDFAQDIKSQLLNQKFLVQEFILMRGRESEKYNDCIIM